MPMPASARKNMSLPLTATGSMMRWTASATRIPVTAQLHRTEARAARTSTRWYLRNFAVQHCLERKGSLCPWAPVTIGASLVLLLVYVHGDQQPQGCSMILNHKSAV